MASKKPDDCDTDQKKATSVDVVFEHIKPFGRYQWLTSIIYIVAYCLLDINNLFMGYGGMKPKWTCSNPEAYNGTSDDPAEPTDHCAVFANCPRENLTYVSNFYSIVSEWSLVCDQAYLMSLITSIQMIGLLIGALMIGPVTDLYGRKLTYIAVLFLEMTLGALSGLSTSAVVFAVFRFCIGWCVGADMVVGWVFVAESTTNRYRFLIRSVAAVALPLWNQVFIAYVTKGWKLYSIVGNLETVLLLPVIALFTYESPRWLAQKGRIDEATEILEKIAKVNRTQHVLPEIKIALETGRTETNGKSRKYYIWDLFRTRRLAVYTLGNIGVWFAGSLAHYGMFFDIGNLPTNIYMNGAILAAVTMLIIPLAAYEVYSSKVNRKYVIMSSFLLAAICNTIVALRQSVMPASEVTDVIASLASVIGQ